MIDLIFLIAKLIVALFVILIGGSLAIAGACWFFFQARTRFRESLANRPPKERMFERILTFFADLTMIRCAACKMEQGTNKDCPRCRAHNPQL